MEKTQNPSTLKALLMCILVSLAGGLVFGIIYYIGYYIYYITVLEIALSVLVYLRFKQSSSKGNIAISMLLSTIFVILFNFLGVILCESLVVATEYDISFGDSLNIIIELWKTDPEITTYLNTRFGQIVAMALIGCVFAIFIIIGNLRKKKQQPIAQTDIKPQSESPKFESSILPEEQTQKQNEQESDDNIKHQAQNLYFEYYSQCKMFVENYMDNKDMSALKQYVNTLKHSANNIEQNIKEQIIVIIKNEKENPNLTNTNKKVLEIMERMFI